ncbi:hypothetical protein [Microvirga subterranea]|uniref:Uncharacterized protein n=1 Tax=Microvirga subterranea TaxID=186651 RepID=A0A370HUX5_9HYPH|nr:hypothetical protein [Microvirga subterranea]RDI62307.1 hypothetical protein DES45_101575 [Microvirga subterranea]
MRMVGAVIFGLLCLLSIPFALFSMMVLAAPATAEPPGVFLAYLLIIASWLLSVSLGFAGLSLLRARAGWQIAATMPLFPLAVILIAGLSLGIF